MPTLAVSVVLVICYSIFVEVWTNKLWFSSLGYGSVYTTVLWTRVGMFAVFGSVLAAAVVGNALLAFRMRPILLDGYRNPTVERYQDIVDPIRRWLLVALGAVMLLFGGASASGNWRTYLLWRNGSPFGSGDVYFHRDIGFFVFGYPWYRFLITFGFTVIVLSFVAAAATHYLYGGIRLQARRDKVAAGAQVQLSVLLGFFMLLKAVSYWLDRYGLAISDRGLFTGISYTDAHAMLPAKNILAVIALICAALFFGNVIRPGWMLPVLGLGLLVLSAVLIGAIWPGVVQRFQVKPSEPDKEAPYIQRNIEATRDAYDLNDVAIKPYPGVTTDSADDLAKQAASLPGVRVIDPRLVADTFEQLQQQRGFYQMPSVLDVDRYSLPGQTEPQDVVLAARELNLDGVLDSQRNWANDHTVYTHGYGVVAAFGDQRSANGQPVWAQSKLPSVGELGDDFEQRVYYGETEPDYSIVGAPAGANPVELNIPDVSGSGQADQLLTYDGEGGVPVGSTFNQLMYASKFWDSSILLSGRVNTDSKVIYDREPREMVEKVAPWLTVDGDAYPAVVDGRLLWIVDGYTTSSHYPMADVTDLSEATSDSLTTESTVAGQQTDNVNYLRNSVKATVDAYDGTVTLYQWDDQDPILKAWSSAFPGVVHPASEMSAELMAHVRYPEDMFKVQREVLSRYHVTDPLTFYQGSENWKVPEDPNKDTEAQPPFFLTVRMPDADPEFSLTSVYVPQNRSNMAAFMAVNADATSGDYGKFTVLELPSDSAVQGPGIVSNALQQDPDVANQLLRYRQTSQVTFGNLLTLPLGEELVYVQPVYTEKTGTGSYPILQFVMVSVGGSESETADRVGFGTTFDVAFKNALSLTGPDVTPPPSNGPGSGDEPPNDQPPGNETQQQQLARYLAEAQAAFDKAQRALDRQDLAGYQRANQQAADALQKAVELESQINAETQPGDGPTTTPPTDAPTSAPPTTN